jgi:hypothetical protein
VSVRACMHVCVFTEFQSRSLLDTGHFQADGKEHSITEKGYDDVNWIQLAQDWFW